MDRKSFWATMPDSCKADAYAGYNCLYGPEGATEGPAGRIAGASSLRRARRTRRGRIAYWR